VVTEEVSVCGVRSYIAQLGLESLRLRVADSAIDGKPQHRIFATDFTGGVFCLITRLKYG
jgi:hypothetical protein